MARRKKTFVDSDAGQEEIEDQATVEEAEAEANAQQSYEEQAPPAEEPKAPRAKRASTRDWQKDYSDHPKFAKFKGEK